jgi:hypothetical protein
MRSKLILLLALAASWLPVAAGEGKPRKASRDEAAVLETVEAYRAALQAKDLVKLALRESEWVKRGAEGAESRSGSGRKR